ncbi:MAG: vanadium-dependent haloperoxidase [Flavobacteriaceae bacterium]|nr:vanadium-dependent haloperoxidase [Flavobacteriaceae bacterium]MCY4267062.1 vanadium-dependent haloperoxidase [Flavobacteriaceae bacterium]MCY4299536.1 vanadium-dependent haloperoxidase [Flavobacteriaceae bacterium]
MPKANKVRLVLILVLFIVLVVAVLTNRDVFYRNYSHSIVNDPEYFQASMKNLTDVIVYDIFSPPVASRVYVYPCIAAYEIVAHFNPNRYNSLVGQVKELQPIPLPQNDKVNPNLSALYAFHEVGKSMIFSEDRYDSYANDLEKNVKNMGVPPSVRKASKEYGLMVANHIKEWANGDLYNQTRTWPKYTILQPDQYWKPTPPDYMDGIEPHWKDIRTMVIDSSKQFDPKPPIEFNLEEGTPFQKQLYQVYQVSQQLNEEQVEIAKFWDCNPYVTHHRGHAMFATKKITPGGHWIGITAIATRQAESSFEETIHAYVNVAITLFDAFISCWEEKWDTLVVRPETLINAYYDVQWTPLLQTPPFPEYTSGHSVISSAAAVKLTDLFGDHFSYRDTIEMEYGLPARKFNSFIEASQEAAISRLYGGIHYMMAIDEGVEQGLQLGQHIVDKLQTKNEPTLVQTGNR